MVNPNPTAIPSDWSPDDLLEAVETAEEAANLDAVVEYVDFCCDADRGGADDWADAAEGALDALYRLVKGGAGGADARLPRLLPVPVRALAAWPREEAVAEVALGCLATVTARAAAGAAAWASDRPCAAACVARVVDAVRALPGEATVQEQACLAIEGLALLHDEFKEALNAVDGMREELIAMRADRITNERNKAYPLRAAKALGIDIE